MAGVYIFLKFKMTYKPPCVESVPRWRLLGRVWEVAVRRRSAPCAGRRVPRFQLEPPVLIVFIMIVNLNTTYAYKYHPEFCLLPMKKAELLRHLQRGFTFLVLNSAD